MNKLDNFYEKFLEAQTDVQKQELLEEVKKQGFPLINEWIHQLNKALEQSDDDQLPQLEDLLAKAEELLPSPEKYSPLWENVWQDMKMILQIKRRIFGQIPAAERSGEWQVLFNNPFTTDGVVTHANLTFPIAAFLFANYRKELHKKEYVSLQKVQRYLTETGD